jgi:cytochrome c oxidase subunit 2
VSSPFNPVSPQGHDISNLFVGVLIVGGVVFALVTGLVIYAAIRYRRRAGDESEPRQEFGRPKLEVLWTAVPIVILAVLFGFTASTMGAVSPGPNGQQPDLIITGYQWWWGLQYPQAGVVTANEIHLPAGRRMLLRLDSADVIHDFWVPQLGRKIDMIPGKTNYLWVEPQTPGTYLGACAEFCGAEHAWMLLRVIVQPQAEYDAWLRAQALPQPTPNDGDAARGAQII